MSDKTVQQRVSVLENDAEHTKSSIARIERMLIDLRSDFLKNQARNDADLSATRRELQQDIESHLKETTQNFAKLKTRLEESIGETDSNHSEREKEPPASRAKMDATLNECRKETDASFAKLNATLDEFRKETSANFARLEKMVGDLSKDLKEYQTAINVELARQKTNTRWIIVFGLGLVGAAFADSVGWVSLIGKLFSGG